MVLVTCVAFLGGPLGMVRTMVRELLEAAPSDAVQDPILGVVREVEARHGLAPSTVLMTKVGPKAYVEVTGRARPGATVAEEHAVRRAIERGLDGSAYDVWLNLELLPG